MRRKRLVVGVFVVAVVAVCTAYIARRASGNGIALFLSDDQRTAVVITALLQFLPAKDRGHDETPTVLHAGDQALTGTIIAKLAESGRTGILPLVEKPPDRSMLILVSRINSWWPHSAQVRVTCYAGIDFPGYQYKFRLVDGRWEETDREPIFNP